MNQKSEAKRKKYGLYDKGGNFLCYRMTKKD